MALSPMMEQYLSIKEDNKDCLLFYRVGDFYEMFFDDARTASRELELVLTGKDCGLKERAPMCGVPHHSCDAYIARLIEKGYKVAICEQVEDPKLAKGLVKRDIVRIVTPGTVVDENFLNGTENNFIGSVYYDGKSKAGVSFADISTGEVYCLEINESPLDAILNEVGRFCPKELLISENLLSVKRVYSFLKNQITESLTPLRTDVFENPDSVRLVMLQFKDSVSPSIATEKELAVKSLGVMLSYLARTQKVSLSQMNKLTVYGTSEYLSMDIFTRRSLELTETMRSKEKKGSLLWVIDNTKTAMGGRMLRQTLERPLIDCNRINKRLDATEELLAKTSERLALSENLSNVYDIERILTKTVYGTVNPRDMRSVCSTFKAVAEIKALLAPFTSQLLRETEKRLDPETELISKIDATVSEDPPFLMSEGGYIKDGVDAELDVCRKLLGGSESILKQIEEKEKEQTGIKLKVGYNRVFGYYIEVTNSFLSKVPPHYIRKQTLTGAERFITEELKELEKQILTAKDRIIAIEAKIFKELRDRLVTEISSMQQTSMAIAELDMLSSFAECARKNGYVKPIVDNSGIIDIKDGRHPVVEKMLTDSVFVPNDTYLDCDENRFSLITGPNMAGKSTYMRQTAIIALMAQIGSFVPASKARIGIVDKIFTRVGAADDLATGQSTFMVEMNEVASILKNATSSSLLIFDEIGRGTSTFDGMSIAKAVSEYVADKKRLGAKTLFATHYHELQMLDILPGINNYSVAVKKRGDEITFLRKIVKGGADQSFGIEVAKLAGIPKDVISRAKDILSELESGEQAAPAKRTLTLKEDEPQFSFEDMAENEVLERLRNADLNVLTPIECMNLLFELKKELEK
ncbi:MAG: DNA mismatch repair protein MutS [Clostridia bacterium]|nr:DNA mismatch repair protein MutS [Clostridia bacterium]